MHLLDWITTTLNPRETDSEEFFYDEMESQSGFCLPLIYQPFDAGSIGHWHDRGSMFDFLHATEGQGKRLLDFGPGDGWPSLIIAPYAREVIGVDGSERRVQVCAQNAARMGISNASFRHVSPGSPLPFEDDSFDGVMAASSVEQTPDPQAALRELFRVLRPGGRLRIWYENLGAYRGGQERQIDIDALSAGGSRVVIYDRQVEKERAQMLRLDVDLPEPEARALFEPEARGAGWGEPAPAMQSALRAHTRLALACTLTHPSGETMARWLREIGFRQVQPTHSGAWFAGQLFHQLRPEDRPTTLEGVDALLEPLVKVVVQMDAPLRTTRGWDPMITAVK
jgi:SAM-dependent methyltransferase